VTGDRVVLHEWSTPRGARRLVLFREPDGTYGAEESHQGRPESCWCNFPDRADLVRRLGSYIRDRAACDGVRYHHVV
jgi:hypothetical protein